MADILNDGIRGMLPREKMTDAAKKLRDVYAIVPGAPFYRREFGFYSLNVWRNQGLPEKADLAALFHFDPPGKFSLGGLGWCEAAFCPTFEEKVLKKRADGTEVAQDKAGRQVLYFNGRRSGFMPEYLDHPVKDARSWEKNVKWRLAPDIPERWPELEKRLKPAVAAAKEGQMICQQVIGGYMYLRSLVGPEGALYLFYDAPELVRDCMETWFQLADAVIAFHQKRVTLDELFLAEDICYNHGPLISPDMIREFLFPYYRRLIDNVRARQIDRTRKLHIQIDTDGDCRPVIDLYREIGMTAMSPFEVASGCDVVAIAKKYPDLTMFGGIDKRILAAGKDAIDREVERVFPPLRARGGYIPTCDHGVPEEVTLENYLHYRKRCVELGG